MRKNTNPLAPHAALATRADPAHGHHDISMLGVWQRHAAAQQSLWSVSRWWRAIMVRCGRLHASGKN